MRKRAALFSVGGGLQGKSFTDVMAVETMELVQKSYSDTLSVKAEDRGVLPAGDAAGIQ